MQDRYPVTEHTRHRRIPARGSHERAEVHAILDEALVCHVGFVHDGQPFVIPTTFARRGDVLYVHGAAASRMLRTLAEGVPVCVTVSLIDGLVFSRSWFHHSMNYRSVLVLGIAREVTDREEKLAAMAALVDRVSPGRSLGSRPPTEKELAATSVLALPITEASAKVRRGGPKEDPDDATLPGWIGHVPLRLVAGSPEPEEDSLRRETPTLPPGF